MTPEETQEKLNELVTVTLTRRELLAGGTAINNLLATAVGTIEVGPDADPTDAVQWIESTRNATYHMLEENDPNDLLRIGRTLIDRGLRA